MILFNPISNPFQQQAMQQQAMQQQAVQQQAMQLYYDPVTDRICAEYLSPKSKEPQPDKKLLLIEEELCS